MRKFLTELQGKTVTDTDGEIRGTLDNVVVDTATGSIVHLLVQPPETEIETARFPRDGKGRLVLSFKSMRSAKDVVMVDLASA